MVGQVADCCAARSNPLRRAALRGRTRSHHDAGHDLTIETHEPVSRRRAGVAAARRHARAPGRGRRAGHARPHARRSIANCSASCHSCWWAASTPTANRTRRCWRARRVSRMLPMSARWPSRRCRTRADPLSRVASRRRVARRARHRAAHATAQPPERHGVVRCERRASRSRCGRASAIARSTFKRAVRSGSAPATASEVRTTRVVEAGALDAAGAALVRAADTYFIASSVPTESVRAQRGPRGRRVAPRRQTRLRARRARCGWCRHADGARFLGQQPVQHARQLDAASTRRAVVRRFRRRQSDAAVGGHRDRVGRSAS